MKSKLTAIVAGALILIGIGASSFAATITTKTAKTISNNESKVKMEPINPAEEARQFEAINKTFQEAGINLTSQQETQIQKAAKKMNADVQQLFAGNSKQVFGQLLLGIFLSGGEGEKIIASTGVGEPIANFYTTVSNTLTPQQRPTWEKIWREGKFMQTASNQQNNFTFDMGPNAVNASERAQNFEKTKKIFSDAGVALTPQQETQMLKAEDKLNADFEQAFKKDGGRNLAGIFAAMLLPKEQGEKIGEKVASSIVINPMTAYFENVNGILNPQQRKVWEQSFNQPETN
jgi:hypothetical protein